MKKLFLLVSCLLLAGCSDADWDHALNYAHLGEPTSDDEVAMAPRTVAPQSAPQSPTVAAAPASPGNSDFCRSVATQDATAGGFDPATQQRVFAQSYAQCVAIYTR